ncbi:Putative universal stress protein [Roseimaritima multifibrata]|uniref:Universal stress protein n=1 Tax=Roseimaritima multifibrata TaxID=1930274 RepID=A0A517MGH4_9BACT|nr:universal stress protein [Roseimaritima multifibrata]QDS93984.1 Putative universal stress protein [Roseimaritima multifibrata]
MKVLLATDGSDSSIDAAKFVRGLAERNDIDLTIMTVSYNPTEYSMQPWMPEWTDVEEKRTRSLLDSTADSLRDHVSTLKLIHKSGPTVPCILDEAADIKADLIVIGAKGHSAIHRVLLGSVSDSVASHAKCSVVVVRPSKQAETQPKQIVVGFDKSAASREAVAEMMELKWDRDSKVNVVSAVEQPRLMFAEDYVGPSLDVDPEQVDAIRETAERMASQIASAIPKTDTKIPVAEHVGSAIVEAAEEDNADLVIVGDTGHSLLGELLLGSTSKYVLRHAPCSVWISRHHYKTE